ncbi:MULTISPECIES: hypothetical protein [unclassified Microcoleus]|uniref:hypothetical protein n=1 Tax=unclassified Microcoleus TaxID=2642155 RepID=UPI002FD341D2
MIPNHLRFAIALHDEPTETDNGKRTNLRLCDNPSLSKAYHHSANPQNLAEQEKILFGRLTTARSSEILNLCNIVQLMSVFC